MFVASLAILLLTLMRAAYGFPLNFPFQNRQLEALLKNGRFNNNFQHFSNSPPGVNGLPPIDSNLRRIEDILLMADDGLPSPSRFEAPKRNIAIGRGDGFRPG